MLPPQFIVREAVRRMPYRFRDQGLTAMEMMVVRRLIAMITALLGAAGMMPAGLPQRILIIIAITIFLTVLRICAVPAPNIQPINGANRDRGIDSFSDGQCWHFLQFRRDDLHTLFDAMGFPVVVHLDNGGTCTGEYAFCLMLYRLAYPTRLFTLQFVFGREYTQLSRIFQYAIVWTETNHIHRVEGARIINWFSQRFDQYHQAILNKILTSPHNPNPGFVPAVLADIGYFLDGTGLEIARLGGGVQNPFWNGYLHGHYLIFQGLSFPDGMTLVEGAFPGYYNDVAVWNASVMRITLDQIMNQRFLAGRPRLKVRRLSSLSSILFDAILVSS